MTALRTRLANMSADPNIWLDRLSNWQFVAAVASTNVLAFTVAGCILGLITGFSLRVFITTGVIETALMTSILAWRRWK